MNSYGFAPTAPSRPRVYQFHHLGSWHTLASWWPLILLAGVGGLEPPTCGFGDRCSSQLSYTPTAALLPHDSTIIGRKGPIGTALALTLHTPSRIPMGPEYWHKPGLGVPILVTPVYESAEVP